MNEIEKQLEQLINNQELDKIFKLDYKKILRTEFSDLIPNNKSIFEVEKTFNNDGELIKNFLVLANNYRIKVEKDRVHTKGSDSKNIKFDSEEIKKLSIDDNTFYKLCNEIFNIELVGDSREFDVKDDLSNEIVSLINRSKMTENDALKFVNSLAEGSESFNALVNSFYHNKTNLGKEVFRELLQKCVDKYPKINNKSFYKDVVKNIFYKANNNDYLIENNYIYYLFTKNLYTTETPINYVINPTIFFIDKWVDDNTLHGKTTYFIVENNELAKLLDNIYSDLKISGSNISFISYNSNIESVDNQQNNVLLFINHHDTLKNKIDIFDNLIPQIKNQKTSIYIYDTDNILLNNKSTIHDRLSSDFCINKIYLLPAGINGSTSPQKKTVIIANSKNKINHDENILIPIYKFKLNTSNKKYQYLYQIGFSFDITNEEYSEGLNILRSLYNDKYNQYVSKNTNKGESIIYNFSDEISFYLRMVKDKKANEKIRIRCNVIDPEEKLYIEKKPRILKETKKESRSIKKEEIDEWLEENYPFSSVNKETSEVHSIRDLARNHFLKLYDKKPISLKTLIFLYPEIDGKVLNYYKDIYKDLCKCDLLNVKADSLSSEYINDWISEYYDSQIDDNYYNAQKFIYLLLDFAVSKKHIDKNIYTQEYKQINNDQRGLRQISSSILKRYLTRDESTKLLKDILKNIDEGKTEYLAILIKMLTGLDTITTCSLKWKDFKKVEITNDQYFYQLVIRRKTSLEDKRFIPLSKKEEYRIIPCSKLLEQYLLKQLKDTCIEYGVNSAEELNEVSIIQGKNTVSINHTNHIVKPSYINDILRELLDKSCNYLEDKYVSHKKGRKKINVSKYKGDILRSNYRHHAISYCGFSEGEVEYLLGNKPSSTFAFNYCDYGNNSSQSLLWLKQNRVSLFFDKKETKKGKQYIKTGDLNYTSNITDTSKFCNLIIEISPDTNGTSYLEIDNQYGYSLQITEYKNG